MVFMVGMAGAVSWSWAQPLLHQPGSAYFDDVPPASPLNDDIGWAFECGAMHGDVWPTHDERLFQTGYATLRGDAAGYLMATMAFTLDTVSLCDKARGWQPLSPAEVRQLHWVEAFLRAHGRERAAEDVRKTLRGR